MAQTDCDDGVTIYWTTFLLVAVLAWAEQFSEARRYLQVLYIPVLLWLVVLAGFRFHADNDYAAYEAIFLDVPPLQQLLHHAWVNVIPDSLVGLESGYILLIGLSKSLGLSFQGSLLAISALSISIYAFVIARASPYWYVSLLLYLSQGFWVREFTQIRFGLTCALALLSFYYVARGRNIVALVLAAICPLVHLSGLVALGGVAFQRAIKPAYIAVALILCLALFYLNALPNWNTVLTQIPQIGEKLLKYANTEESDPIKIFAVLSSAAYCLVAIYCYTHVAENHGRNMIWLNLYIVSTLILLLFGQVGILQRLAVVFATSLYVIAPICLETMYRRNRTGEALLLLSIATFHSLLLFVAKFSILRPYNSNFDIFS
ncbi:EpsG family protein [Cupriavidus nantongensis]|uniref:EpsG family protein n=1 Tax=Cupriavidus nantongensis TaxID=1796606 RepID=A0A142JN62_9BURK|nr:EpsG family protein [Cupriavidus nantongensis]AMR79524.1 hypothetical protein A2G96_18235 [Cupriavidus nantongensis]